MAVPKDSPAATGASERASASRTRRRGRIRLWAKWCKGCGLCVAFCPQGVFALDEEQRPVVAYPDRCIACKWCEIHCPDFAIVVESATEQVDARLGEAVP